MLHKQSSVDSYLSRFPSDVRAKLALLRGAIAGAAPDSTETIKYGIPTFVVSGKNLVHFGGYKNHIGFYPAPSAIEAFKDSLAPYKQSKGAVQFPLDVPLPIALIQKIVKFRVKENKSQQVAKQGK